MQNWILFILSSQNTNCSHYSGQDIRRGWWWWHGIECAHMLRIVSLLFLFFAFFFFCFLLLYFVSLNCYKCVYDMISTCVWLNLRGWWRRGMLFKCLVWFERFCFLITTFLSVYLNFCVGFCSILLEVELLHTSVCNKLLLVLIFFVFFPSLGLLILFFCMILLLWFSQTLVNTINCVF